MYHPASIRIGLHTAGPLDQAPRTPLQRLLWSRGFTYSPRYNGYVPPLSLSVDQQIHLVHDAVHAVHSLGHPVAHFHHPEAGL
ncbi:hypothetical protein [Streptomyces sp. NBC_01264]|uniref:hypothetical protein n=1 Tax=Streptomyces sp. NBC_01264 TaxID=2903804 RepID=UPI00225AC8C2|nr:hypothetical protein [Streptomyces sp. NBC_01264]MCX4776875.1 hypothetical protein [Streptomyces sp. NBC_01264]